MADFNTTQAQLEAARAALQQAQVSAVTAAARAQQAQATLDTAQRQARDEHGQQKLAQLAAAAKQALADSDAAKAALGRSRASVSQLTGIFGQFSDPRQNINLLSASSPFLLFPVRLETRFRTIAQQQHGIAAAGPRHQLWVRIYPDDCSIDTFEPTLSQSQLNSIKNYWQSIWSAGGIENDERGAWAALVRAHSSGRAGWLADNFKPTNSPPSKKIDATDEILVIPTSTALSDPEAGAISDYWQAVWLADGDGAKTQAAQTALEGSVGAARAAELVTSYAPFNLGDKPAAPLKKFDVRLSTAFVVFPPDPDTTVHSWSLAPQVRQFPDRFIVLGYSDGKQTLEAVGNPVTLPLYAGPDPSADPTETIHPDPPPDGPDLFVPDELKWMVDFDRAVAAGLGIAIDITPEQARAGFDRLLVVGLKLSTNAEKGSTALQELLAHHQWSRSGFSLLPQGTPTHNTTGARSGHGGDDDSDVSFNDRKNQPLFTPVPDPGQKADGQWFAEFLGLDPAYVATVHGSGDEDQKRARAMQTALWPATLGHWMNTLFTPTGAKTSIFSDNTIEQTRHFFTQYVSGRGPLPAIRIGGQPYGILPATAFSRIQWYEEEFRALFLPSAFLRTLYGILMQFDADWARMSLSVSRVGDNNSDPHQTLLNVVAHHPSSVEYYSRTAENLQQIYNMLNFWALGPDFIQGLIQLGLQAGAIGLLQKFGYTGSALPDLLNHFFLKDNPQITTVIDDRPLSETSGIRAYTDAGDNYIQWMIAAAGSLETLRAESGFTQNKSPQALLYLYLRHALMLGYYDASYNFHRDTGILSGDALLAMRAEPTFVHVAGSATASESRFAALYKSDSRITGSPTKLVSEYIGEQIGILPQVTVLASQTDALKTLARASTAELERLFAEHIDTCSYRYDAWLLGLVSQRISNQIAAKGNADGGQPSPRGIYLGAYAWVEYLRPSTAPLVPAQIPPELQQQFPGTEPLMVDTAGGGYIHGPSIQHANAAAVLRSGYLANASSASPDTLAVNLSSDRVRVALGLIEGIRNGQSLGALLGYRFERGLHDAYALAEVDKFIYPLRKAFPLAADALASTKTDPNVPIEAIEARNVLDGKKLVDQVRSSGKTAYPYGLGSQLPAASGPGEQDALNQQTSALLNAYDAIADMALAEGVFQAVQGNYDRVASTMEAYTTGNFPPEPQVVQTPPAGVTLTHRFAMQLKPGLPAPAGATPRATAEPAVDEWLGRMLPPFAQLACTVVWNDPVTGNPKSQTVTLNDLGLRPLDVLYLLKPDNVQMMAEFDDRILARVYTVSNPRPDAVLKILYLQAGAGQISFFELSPLLRELRTLATQSRPLRASDVRRANDASQNDNSTVFADRARISGPNGALKTLGDEIEAYLATLAPLLADTVTKRAQIINSVDTNLDKAIGYMERAAKFAMPSSGWGFAYDWRRGAFRDLLSQVRTLANRWTQKLSDFDVAILAYNNLPAGTSDADRFAALQAAELLVSSQLEPLPATPNILLNDLTRPGGKRDSLQSRLNQFLALLGGAGSSFSALYNSVAALSVQEFDSQPFDITSFGDRAITVTEDISRILTGQLATIRARVDGVNKQLAAAAAAASASDQVSAIQAAAKLLLGDDFQLVPEFTISVAQGGEWANAFNASTSGALFKHLKTTLNIDFPVDEWLYGAARVRPPLHSWEALVMLASAFDVAAPTLTPIQLPYEADAPWLALQFPDNYTLDSDRLLYTCAYSQVFDPNARQCGLLVDEWAEVLPATTRDTGITFNFNRPDNEPPQTMLLVTPPSNNPQWQWADLVDALNETLDLAKKRAVEPSALDLTVYARFLPATAMAATTYAITISTILTAANGALEVMPGGSNA